MTVVEEIDDKKNDPGASFVIWYTRYLDCQLFFNRVEFDCLVSQEVPFVSEDVEKCLRHKENEEKQLKEPVSNFLSLASAWEPGSWRAALIFRDSGRMQLQTAPTHKKAVNISACHWQKLLQKLKRYPLYELKHSWPEQTESCSFLWTAKLSHFG